MEVKTAFEPRWSIFHLSFCLFNGYQPEHGKWHVGLLLPKDGLIFSSTVFIVVSVYQQKITPRMKFKASTSEILDNGIFGGTLTHDAVDLGGTVAGFRRHWKLTEWVLSKKAIWIKICSHNMVLSLCANTSVSFCSNFNRVWLVWRRV